MEQQNTPGGGPWFRVPRNLPALEPEEATAWMLLLGLWHGGHDPSIGEMRRRTGWGAGRMTAFMGKVSAWAAENGAFVPVRRCDLKQTLKNEGDGNVSGTVPERERNVSGTAESAEKAANKLSSERERNAVGTTAECYRNDSRARAPSQRRSDPEETENKIMNMSPPPAAALFARPRDGEVPPAVAPAPEPVPKTSDTLTAEETAAWAAYRFHHPTAKATPPKASVGLLRAAIREHGADAVISVIRWAHQSESGNARYLQGQNPSSTVYLGLDNILRREKLPNRIELAAKEAAGEIPQPRMSALPPGVQPRKAVVIDAESGRVVDDPPPIPKSKGLDLMLSTYERMKRQREAEEEEERLQSQEVQDVEA